MIKKSLLLVFGISYLFAALYYAFGFRVTYSLSFYLFAIAYMWVPGIVSLILAKKEGMKLPLFRFNRIFPIAGFFAAGASLAALYISSFFAEGWNPVFLEQKTGVPVYILVAYLLGSTVNAVVATGEELFWRGYLHEKCRHFGPLKASLVIGVLWGVWHAPIIAMGYNYPGHPIGGIFMMTLLTVVLSPMLYYFRDKGKSIAPASAFHGVFNAFAGFSFLFFANPNYFLLGSTGLIGLVIFALLSGLALSAMYRKKAHDS